MKRTEKRFKTAALTLAALLWLLPLGAQAQTVRGDFDYDGDFDLSDVTQLINYVLFEKWSDVPYGVERDTVTVKGIPIVMARVEGGSYERFGGTVSVDGFWIAQTEVTQQLWQAVTGSNPSRNRGAAYKQHPVEQVTWNDCQAFIESLNELTGRTFRLPTDLEWEFAARGGNYSRGTLYAGSDNPMLVAWYYDITGNCHKDVGLLKPNELGLYDMCGNVSEWVQDSYPLGQPNNGTSRIYRGGNFMGTADQNVIGYAGNYNINSSLYFLGLRLAMSE